MDLVSETQSQILYPSEDIEKKPEPDPIQTTPSFSIDPTDIIIENEPSNSEISFDNSIIISAADGRRDTTFQMGILRKLKIFPLFGDPALAKFSVNYFLYRKASKNS